MEVYVLGVGTTRFARHPERSHRDLGREAVQAAVEDAGVQGRELEQIWFGNCAMDRWGQRNLRGQVSLAPLVQEGLLDGRAPVANVEAGCATGSLALHGALDAVAAEQADLALAVGVEKVFFEEDPAQTLAVFEHGIDRMHPQEWSAFYQEQSQAHGVEFSPARWRVLFLDLHAALTQHHMARHGTTPEMLAAVAAKAHAAAALNPLAQKSRAMTAEQVLADKAIVGPLTRSMCCPISDGAAAAVVCSARWLSRLPSAVRHRAIRVRGWARAGGTLRDLDAPSVTTHAARRLFGRTGISPGQVDLAAVHDATAGCELIHLEALGLFAPGEAGPATLQGRTGRDGRLPVNPMGGLIARGHPLGATGLGQIHALVTQLRGEAGDLQAGRRKLALHHNAGGQIGWDEAVAAVTLLSGS